MTNIAKKSDVNYSDQVPKLTFEFARKVVIEQIYKAIKLQTDLNAVCRNLGVPYESRFEFMSLFYQLVTNEYRINYS